MFFRQYIQRALPTRSALLWTLLALTALVFAVFAATRLVFAERTEVIYVLPTLASADGWDGGERALAQDLSASAQLADFGPENSAEVAFGAFSHVPTASGTPFGADGSVESLTSPQTPSDDSGSSVDGGSSAGDAADAPLNIPIPPSIIPVDFPVPSGPDAATSTAQEDTQASIPARFLNLLLGGSPRNGIPFVFAQTDTIAVPAESIDSTGQTDSVAQTDSTNPIDPMQHASTSEESESSVGNAPLDAYGIHDPRASAVCATIGTTCHILELGGFGVSGDITSRPIRSVTVNVSFASRGGKDASNEDRLIVRLFRDGVWEYLGEVSLGGENSNDGRGGYLTFPIETLTHWSDLVGAKISLEYVRESDADALAFVDAAWFSIEYTKADSDEVISAEGNILWNLSRADALARIERRNTLRLPGTSESVYFGHATAIPGARITLSGDRSEYHALGTIGAYMLVANDQDSPKDVRLQFHATPGAIVRSVDRWQVGMPSSRTVMSYGTTGYFCSSGWASTTDASSPGTFMCADTGEERTCDGFNLDQTNCFAESTKLGVVEESSTRDGWTSIPLTFGSLKDDAGFFERIISMLVSGLPEDAVPPNVVPVAYVPEPILLEPGQAAYLRVRLSVPPNSLGDFVVEALGDDGEFGVLSTKWSGSWNHRLPIEIPLQASEDGGTAVVPIDLSRAPESFWSLVRADGTDIRFAGSNNDELPFWLARWDKDRRTGLAWVRVPLPETDGTTTINLYYDNQEAIDPVVPRELYRTEELTARYVLFGGEHQGDIVAQAVALAPDVRVRIGDREPVTLSEGEHLLVSGVRSGEMVYADGPVSATAFSVGDRAFFAPLAFSGTDFAIPQLSPGSSVSFAAIDRAAELDGGGLSGTEVIPNSIVSSPLETGGIVHSDASVVLAHVNPYGGSAAVLPMENSARYAVKEGRHLIASADDASEFLVRCERGESREVDGRRAGSTWEERICIEGDPYATEAVSLIPRGVKIGSVMEGSSAGTPITPLPRNEFDSRYVLDEDAAALVALCAPEDGEIIIELAGQDGHVLASSTCAARGMNPGKAVFFDPDSPVASGAVLRSASGTPFAAFAWTRTAPGSPYGLRVKNLFGMLASRGPSRIIGTPRFGGEEFVVPGEHRPIDTTPDGQPKEHVNDYLLEKREWNALERPSFKFRYKPQSIGFVQNLRDAFGVRQFTVTKVELIHQGNGVVDVPLTIGYGEGQEWGVEVGKEAAIIPGKYTLRAQIEEGGETYVDEFDFFWGLLAINYRKSVYTPNEDVAIDLAALSYNGNTVCDADLRLWITDPSGNETQVPVTPSGRCNGNNVVDVPDYSARYQVTATGTYAVRLVRLDRDGNAMSQITDRIEVRESVPYVIEREGPTRIYPVAAYGMKIRLRALEDFSGEIIERMPKDFVVIDRGNATLALDGETMTATWGASLRAGDVVEYTYRFDAPDRSPELYELGPLQMRPADETSGARFEETRAWQIASDAAGKMMIYWDNATYTPTGWTCVSCISSDPLYSRFLMGSSTYGVTGGTYGHTPTASAVVYTTGSTGVGPVTTNNTINAPLSHSHTLTPTIASSSNFVAYHTLRVLEFNSAGEPPLIPAGAILPFDVASSSLPANWYRYAELNGRYPLAASTTKANGGSNTHSHAVTGTLTNSTESGLRSQNGVINGATARSHNHTLTATTTSVMSNEPPYREVLYARLTATSAPTNYLIGMWSDTPADQWVLLSGAGGALENLFLKASTTYGGTGGSETHTHPDIVGATTSVANTLSNYTANASNGQAPSTHIHSVDITGFSTDSHLPRYATVIYAKRLSGVVQYTQENFHFYANTNGATPSDPWPAGGTDVGEGEKIDSPAYSVKFGDILRLRLSLSAGNSTSTVGAQSFKLQYVASDDCASALNWSDVAAISSSTAMWRGYNNSGVSDGTTLPSVLLSTAQHAESYEEENPSVLNPTQIGIGEVGEWDWVVQQNGALAGTNYCFRMVKSDGTPLDTYAIYPEALTNAAPQSPTLVSPFDNEKVGTTTPTLKFYADDTETNDVDYQVQISSSNTFASTILDVNSTDNPELFENLVNTSNKAPFFVGDTIGMKVTSALTNGATYWWRVRSKDPNGSNQYGAWSSGKSFTVDTSVTISTWFQTTSEQFQTGSFIGANSSTSDAIMLNTGSSTGVAYSPQIDFSLAQTGTNWGSLAFSDVESGGVVGYQIEFLSATGTWMLVPDADLPGNSASFGTSPVSLLTLDPGEYPTIRIRANMTNVLATPKINDWTIAWGYNVQTPTLLSPFDNAIVASTSPYLEFSAVDPNNDAVTYQVSWSTDPNFTSSTTRSSDLNNGFRNITYATDTDPFNSGERIRYVFQPADTLTASTTYFWRVRARDPLGGNTWSFWSKTRSFTVGTWARVGIWYQTVDGQFAKDTLTAAQTYGANRLRVATQTSEAMIAYGESGTQLPRYRIWDGSAWSAEGSANSIGATLYWAILRSAPITGKYFLGTIGSNNDSMVQIYDNGAWGTPRTISSSLSNNRARGMDIAFESLSGRAMIVSCDGDPDPTYQVFDGTNWATGTIDIGSSSNCEWIRLAANPATNEIILAERDTGRIYEAQVWNATTSTWGNSTTLGRMQEPAHEGMGIEYEATGTQALFVTSNNTANQFVYKSWNGTTWGATTTVTLTNEIDWLNIRRAVTNENMHVCGVDSSNNITRTRWTGAAFAANTNAVTTNSRVDRRTDCVFENTAGRVGYIMQVYGDTTANQTRYTVWNGAAWSAGTQIATIPDTVTDQLARTQDGTILGAFYDAVNLDLLVSRWNGTSWSAQTNIETSPSVTTAPYGEPFMIAPKSPVTRATVIGQPVRFEDGNSPAWKRALWTDTKYGASQILYQVEYQTATGTWELIPDSVIPGNSLGTSTSPLSLSGVDSSVYSTIRLRANMSCDASLLCPYLDDWTIEWAEGIRISGTAKQSDLTTNVTSGTVSVAVNGVLSGKTGTIGANGQWAIDNVTVFPNNIITVWISGVGDGEEAVAVGKYTVSGDIGGFSLNQRWLTIGSASTTGATITLSDLSLYDNSVSGNEDIFHDVSAGGDLTVCSSGACSNAGLYVLGGNVFRPNSSAAKVINTYDLRIAGTLTADANTIKVGGNWRNLGTFTANTSTVVMNATSSVRSVDQTGATQGTFYNITFGESGSTATWNFATDLTATGTMLVAFGTTSPGNFALTLQGDLTIGAGGTFQKGNATTTFSGTSAKTITDNSSPKQDLGKILIDGTSKTIQLGSDVRATDITIGADDTLDAASAWTLTVLGNWRNLGTFTARTGTVAFAATSTGHWIDHGASNFYNLTYSGGGGGWSFRSANATATNNVTISAGTATLPAGTLAVGGSLDNSGGSFISGSGAVRMYSATAGKTVRANGSDFFDLQFAGAGSWTISDANATTTAEFSILQGSVTLPAGTLSVGTNFRNLGGSFAAGSGIVRMTAASGSRTITANGSSLANLQIAGSGSFAFSDANATATADVSIVSGTLAFPSTNFAIGGSFSNSSTFTAGTSNVLLYATSGTRTINPGSSSFASVSITGAGSFTIVGNATATGAFSLTRAGGFTVNTGLTLAVGGTFTNIVGGASTTWSGSTLFLYSGTNYTMNTKSAGADTYGTLKVGPGTQVRMWGSSAAVYTMDSTGSLYSQNHNGISGDLYIFGNYLRTSGTDYWSYGTDFDGTPLGGSSRQVNVRFAADATSTYLGATLEIVGGATATTTIDRQSSGNYGVVVNGGTINAQYYQFRNVGRAGVQLLASTTVTSLRDGDYELGIDGGTMLTIASTTIDTNPALQIYSVRFATSTGVASGFNVTETGSPTSYWRFRQHSGNYDGESFDNDPGGNPGYIRWDDSSFVITISGNVYSDAGVTPMGSPTCDNVTNVVRVRVDGAGNFAAPCNPATGAYTVSGVTFSGDTVMTVYLDTNGGPRAVNVTRSAVADLTGINLYQNRVIVRHEDVSPLSISQMNAYDGGDDSDIPFIATLGSPNTLVLKPDTEFWVWAGKTFVPGGNITLQSGGSGNVWDGKFHIDNGATFSGADGESHEIGGGFQADSGATFSAASSTFTFTATTSGKLITASAPLTFRNVRFNGAGGSWSISQDLQVNGVFLIDAGTVGGTANVTVNGTNVIGNGVIAMTGGTFQMASGGTFGGSTDWTFYNLTFAGSGQETARTGSSTVTVLRALNVFTGHTLRAGMSAEWNLAGSSTPLSVAGTLDGERAVWRYSATGTTSVTPATYWRLWLAPSGLGSPTYTLGSGSFTIRDTLTIGDGTNAVSVNANTNDPAISVFGNMHIRSGATFVGSDSGSFVLYRDWYNDGVYTSSSGTTTFAATSTGRLIVPGSSAFGAMMFDSDTGGWTISGNATATVAFVLNRAQNFTQSSGTTLAVGGVFTNYVGGSATTWDGATLKLYSGTGFTINSKTNGGDRYNTLDVSAGTHVRLWNSSATTTLTSGASSVYSQDHAGVDGDLYIWGAYTRSTGTDYWSVLTDFDGADLSTSSPRSVQVRFAPSASMALTGGGLEVVGNSTATTTIDRQSTGNFSFTISGGSTTMRFFSLRNADINGLRFTGTPTVNVMNDSEFELGVSGGSAILVASTVIDANPLKTFFRNRFATSTAGPTGYNVQATGVAVSAWRFSQHTGEFSGEAYDLDPGGDPGYIIWDDSAANITISGHVYSDEGKTPIGAPTCDGVTQNVRLRVQGLGSYTSACDSGTGAYSISGVIFNPGDTLTVYLDTGGGARAVNVTIDPATNISDMDLYQNRVIVRHEDTNPITIADMDIYDGNNDADIPFAASLGSPNSLAVRAGTGLIVWNNKTFDPQGNVTLHANASANSWDGSLRLAPSATLSGAGNIIRVGGEFLADNGALVSVGSTTMEFFATTTGKRIAASTTQTFGSLSFTGVGGAWDASGVGTSTGSVSITNGTVTLPSATLAIGESLDVGPSGAFSASGNTLWFYATSSGKIIQANGSTFGSLVFRGTGGSWRILDTNATTTGSVVIDAGTLNLPSGTFAVGTDYLNRGGLFGAGSGLLRFTSSSGSRFVQFGSSTANDVQFAGSSTFAFLDTAATTTGDFLILQGTTTLPSTALGVGGNFLALGVFNAGTSTVGFTATTGAKSVDPRISSFGNVLIAASGSGGIIITGNATTTGAFEIRSAPFFTQLSGTTLAVGGAFTNQVGGSITTWTGSTLSLSGGAFSMNSKTAGGDGYEYIRIASSTQIRSWNSSSTAVYTDSNSSWYSQDHNAVDGSLYIYGNYLRTSGADYWSYATDFDGTALSGGARRQVNVRFAANATSTYTNNSTLQIIGSPSASTTIDRISTGSYAVIIDSSTLSAQYHVWQNLGRDGLDLRGTTTLATFQNGDFTLGISGGSLITIASSSIAQNASQYYGYFRFATSSGVTGGANVRRIGTTTNAITFQYESGNFSGEAYDEDGDDACGSIRWSDSACLFVDQSGYRWRNDDGGEGAPSSAWYDTNWSKRKRVRILNTSSSTLTDVQVKINVAYDSDMQSDFDDLRFTDSSGTTSIPYWIENSLAAASSTVWVKVPTLPASSYADIYMYYGNGAAIGASSGTSTFRFFDDFEDGNITEYSGDTGLFEASTAFNYERTRGLDATAGNEGAQATDGIYRDSVSVGQGTSFRFYQYIDMTTGGSDEPCVLFAVGSPGSGNQNYGVCLQPFGADKVVIARNVSYNGRSDGSTNLATKNVTYSTGWYETRVDWLPSGRIDVNVYDSTGAFFASTTAVDTTYSSGGIGFTFWGQHGGWDVYFARTYVSSDPTATFGIEQSNDGATWKAAENTPLGAQSKNENVRLRLTIKDSGSPITNQNFRLQVAPKGSSPNCEAVQATSYQDVPAVTGGCGSSPACIFSSTHYSDRASTTQLLSVPLGFEFSQGQIIEDPSTQTGNIDVASGYVTEVEYALQMTAFATQNAYCFRVTNAGTALDNYSRVAEMSVLQPPSISDWSFNGNNNIALTEGTTTRIYATGTVTDFNGYTDFVAATSTFYRSGATGGRFCASDQNDCYQIASTSCLFLNCSGNSCTLSCSAFLQYFADPTDTGSPFASQFWDAFVDVWDTTGLHATASSSQDIYTLQALAIPESISYGSIVVGNDTGNTNATTSVTNTGNSLLDLLLSGTDMTAGAANIPVYYQRFATTSFTYSSCAPLCTPLLSTTTIPVPLGVEKPTTTAAVWKDVLWGVAIPAGSAAATYSGVNTFLAD